MEAHFVGSRSSAMSAEPKKEEDLGGNNLSGNNDIAGYYARSYVQYLCFVLRIKKDVKRNDKSNQNLDSKLTPIVSTFFFPLTTFVAKTWAMEKENAQKIGTLKMWAYRKMLRVPWTARGTDKSIVEELNVQTELITKNTRILIWKI